jgi:hypothetical protein
MTLPHHTFCCPRHAFITGYTQALTYASLEPVSGMLSVTAQNQIERAIKATAEQLADRYGLRHPEGKN